MHDAIARGLTAAALGTMLGCEPSSDAPTNPTVFINGDDVVSPLTLNVEVANPTAAPRLALQIRAVGGTFNDAFDALGMTETCVPLSAADAGPAFIETIVFAEGTAATSVEVFAQLYQQPSEGGVTPRASDASADGSTADAGVASNPAVRACSGTAVYSGAAWPGPPSQVVDAGAGDAKGTDATSEAAASDGSSDATDASSRDGGSSTDATLGDSGTSDAATPDGPASADSGRADAGATDATDAATTDAGGDA